MAFKLPIHVHLEVSLWLFLRVAQHLDSIWAWSIVAMSLSSDVNRCCILNASSSVPGPARRVVMAEKGERVNGWLRSAEVLTILGAFKTEEQVTLGLCAPQGTAASQNKPTDQKIPAIDCMAGLMVLWLFPSCPRESERCTKMPVTLLL